MVQRVGGTPLARVSAGNGPRNGGEGQDNRSPLRRAVFFVLRVMQMPKQFFMAVALVLALSSVPLRASGPVCGMSMPAMQKADCMACCAAMKSCALPQQNPTQPTAGSALDQQTVAMIAPARPVLLGELSVTRVTAPRLVTRSRAHAPPRLALFCSFLI